MKKFLMALCLGGMLLAPTISADILEYNPTQQIEQSDETACCLGRAWRNWRQARRTQGRFVWFSRAG